MPLTHNDGRPVSPDKFQQTRDELIAQFGAVPENQDFMAAYKQTLLERFEQIEIYMVSFSVEVI